VSKTPDFIEPFVGWKGLLADAEGSLWSPAMETPWPTREPLAATCERKKHTPPATSCSCGIYAVKSFDDLLAAGYNWGQTEDGKTWVVAKVSLWGRVRAGRIGYRSQLAYPKKVYVPAYKLPLGARIRERYGVPIGAIDRFTGRRT
jgi:hypothetical protein